MNPLHVVGIVASLYKRLARGDDKGALIGELIRKQVWKNNLIFREIEVGKSSLLHQR